MTVVRKFESCYNLPQLPLEVIHRISIHLAELGCRSAVTAALIHKSFSKEALDIAYSQDIVAFIRRPHTLLKLLAQIRIRKLKKRIDVLRIGELRDSSLGIKLQISRIAKYLEKVKIVLTEPALSPTTITFSCDNLRQTKLFMNSSSYTFFAGGLDYTLEKTWSMKHINELSMVEPQWGLVDHFIYCYKPKQLFFFFIDDHDYLDNTLKLKSLSQYAFDLDHPLLDFNDKITYHSSQATHISFVIAKEVIVKEEAQPSCSLTWTCTRPLESGVEVKKIQF